MGAEILAVLVILCLFLCLILHIFSLPGNWVILVLVALWKWTHPSLEWGWAFLGILTFIAFVGEILEFVFQARGVKKYGGSSRGNWGAFVFGIVGAILGAPFLFGLGALIGALVGAYLGCFGVELLHGRSRQEAARAATGAMWGRVFGFVFKVGLGMVMIVLSIPRIWPG